jgi:hypothetical protein
MGLISHKQYKMGDKMKKNKGNTEKTLGEATQKTVLDELEAMGLVGRGKCRKCGCGISWLAFVPEEERTGVCPECQKKMAIQ